MGAKALQANTGGHIMRTLAWLAAAAVVVAGCAVLDRPHDCTSTVSLGAARLVFPWANGTEALQQAVREEGWNVTAARSTESFATERAGAHGRVTIGAEDVTLYIDNPSPVDEARTRSDLAPYAEPLHARFGGELTYLGSEIMSSDC